MDGVFLSETIRHKTHILKYIQTLNSDMQTSGWDVYDCKERVKSVSGIFGVRKTLNSFSLEISLSRDEELKSGHRTTRKVDPQERNVGCISSLS